MTTTGTVRLHRVLKAPPERIYKAVLDPAANCTGEHGVGIGKLHAMPHEHGPAGLALMRAIKNTMDPKGILNPGKVLP